GRGHQGAVGLRDADVGGLAAVHPVEVGADRTEPGQAVRTGAVAGVEAGDDEVTGFHRGDLGADLHDDPAALVADRLGFGDGVVAAVAPQVRAADAGRADLDDGIGGVLDDRVRTALDAHVAGRVNDGYSHGSIQALDVDPWCGKQLPV